MQKSLKKQLDMLSVRQDEMQKENNSMSDTYKELNVKSYFNSLTSATNESKSLTTNLSMKLESQKEITDNLSEIVREMKALEAISGDKDGNTLIRKNEFDVLFKGRLSLEETVFKSEIEPVHKQLEETQSNLSMLICLAPFFFYYNNYK